MTDPTRQALAEAIYRAVLDASDVPGSNYPEAIARVLAAHETAQQREYVHICRDEHVQIGHNDSEHERCPVCRERDRADAAEARCTLREEEARECGRAAVILRHEKDAAEVRCTALTQQLKGYKEDSDVLRHSNIIEIAVRNETQSVSDYMDHWEGRALKAEAERDRLRTALERVTADMDSAGGDGYGMPECPWCHAEPRDREVHHAADCELALARAALASPPVPASPDQRLVDKTEDAARERMNALNGLRRYEFTTRVQKRTANDPEKRETDLFVRWKDVEPWV